MASQRAELVSWSYQARGIFGQVSESERAKSVGREYGNSQFYLFPFYYLSHIIMIISNTICCVFAFARTQ